MTAYEIIARKRDGLSLAPGEIRFFIQEYLKGTIGDYQMAAFLMAVFFRGMNDAEILALTQAYLDSGKKLELSAIAGKKIDKHSTGGVGDKVSIVLAPLAASLGVIVPMMSGRGLGHTGGTLDKLESIPGLRVTGSLQQYHRQLQKIGVAMFGQSASIVPADRLIYALRDVTATVDSIPLITASIMSKKIAEGVDGLVLDVKIGKGAFIPTREKARQLSRNFIRVGQAFGKEVVVYLTSMDQPLGYKIGNWLEIEECIDCLQGEGPSDLQSLVLEFTAEMLVMAGISPRRSTARKLGRDALHDGRAWDKFLQMVRRQGGNIKVLENPRLYPRARFRRKIFAGHNGFISGFDTRQLGMASVLLGAGRLRTEDVVDPQAGIILLKKRGEPVTSGEPLLEMRSNKKSLLDAAEKRLKNAVSISPGVPAHHPLIIQRISR